MRTNGIWKDIAAMSPRAFLREFAREWYDYHQSVEHSDEETAYHHLLWEDARRRDSNSLAGTEPTIGDEMRRRYPSSLTVADLTFTRQPERAKSGALRH